jgi:DNA-binding NtrC family response regulator
MSETTIKVLLVEDDIVDQMAFERFVRAAALPYAYRIANSCAEARQLLQTMSFDVAILDHCLDDGTAFELRDGCPDLPIIITSGNSSEALAVQAKQAGVSAYVTKDPEGRYLAALRLAIERVMQSSIHDRRGVSKHSS